MLHAGRFSMDERGRVPCALWNVFGLLMARILRGGRDKWKRLMTRHNCNHYPNIRAVFLCSLLFAWIVLLPDLLRAQTSYSVDQVAKAIAATQAQFTSLRVRFCAEFVFGAGRDAFLRHVEGDFARQLPENNERLEYRILDDPSQQSLIIPLANDDSAPVTQPAGKWKLSRQRLACFDGHATLLLDELPAKSGHYHAVIYAGRYADAFPYGVPEPDTFIWSSFGTQVA